MAAFALPAASGGPVPEPVRVASFSSEIFEWGSDPLELNVGADKLFFTARSRTQGRELWVSDGTPGGTAIVKDIWPGSEGAVEQLTVVGNDVYFIADDGIHGEQLWKSDGTEEGTVMIREATGHPGMNGGGNVAVLDDSIVFRSGEAVWKTNGTAEGTVKLKNLPALWNVFYGGSVATVGDSVFFGDLESPSRSSLWKTDGTPGGTLRIKEFTGEGNNGFPRHFARAGDRLFFTVLSSSEIEELWQSDGTAAGTVKLKDLPYSPYAEAIELVSLGDSVFFVTLEGGTLVLWKADGITGGVSSVDDWSIGTTGQAFTLCAGEDSVYLGFAGVSVGFELWKSDGSATGTDRIIGLPGEKADYLSSMYWQGKLYFSMGAYYNGASSLWGSDGTFQGTSLVRAFPSGYGHGLSGKAMAFGDFLYFSAHSMGESQELWRTDGTPEGTGLFKDISSMGTTPPYHLVTAGGVVYFSLHKGMSVEVWRTEGTASGTVLVKSIELTESWSPALSELVVVGNDVYFVSSEAPFIDPDTFEGCKLWKIAAPSSEAVLVKSFAASEGYIGGLTPISGVLYLTAIPLNIEGSPSYWKTDGTETGTVSAAGDFPGVTGYPTFRAGAGGMSYFTVGTQVWKSDGTAAGTELLKDLGTDAEFGLSHFTAVGQSVFFFSYGPSAGYRLWKTDGTEAGTVRIQATFPSWESPPKPAATDEALYFNATSGNRLRLWTCRADSDVATPVEAAGEIPSYITGSNLLVSHGKRLYFAAARSYTESELWVTDGTPSGTRFVKNISPAATGSLFEPPFTAYHGEVFLAARTPETGLEIWRTDGTEEGTRILRDIAPGTGDSQFLSPYPLQVFGSKLFFTAMSEEMGPSLYVYDNSSMDPPDIIGLITGRKGLYSASFSGSIFPNGSATSARLEYGLTTSFGKSVGLPLSPSNSTSPRDFMAELPDLVPGATYHYRVLATNPGGTSVTATGVFTTPAITGPFGMENPFARVSRHPEGFPSVRFEVIAGQTCEIQRSLDLDEWQSVTTRTADAAGVIEFIDENSPEEAAFYRLATPLPVETP